MQKLAVHTFDWKPPMVIFLLEASFSWVIQKLHRSKWDFNRRLRPKCPPYTHHFTFWVRLLHVLPKFSIVAVLYFKCCHPLVTTILPALYQYTSYPFLAAQSCLNPLLVITGLRAPWCSSARLCQAIQTCVASPVVDTMRIFCWRSELAVSYNSVFNS